MFITLTIDTKPKKNNFIKINKKRLNSSKRGLWQKIKDWRKSLNKKTYKLEGQNAMF